MSAIAECVIVDAPTVALYLGLGGSRDTLVGGAERVAYGWSGYVVVTLVLYLEQQGIALMDWSDNQQLSEKLGTTCIVLTPEHRRYLEKLDAASFDARALRAYYEEFNQTSADGVEVAMLDGIRFLQTAISRVRDGALGLVLIG